MAWELPGVCGAAIEFYSQGGSVVRTPLIDFGEAADPDNDPANAVSLSVWVFIHTSGDSHAANGGPVGSEQVLNCNSNFLLDGTTGFTLALEAFPAGNAWRARINSQQWAEDEVADGGGRNQGFAAVSDDGTLVPNQWTQLTAVFDPSLSNDPEDPDDAQLKLYVDGQVYVGDANGVGVSNKCNSGSPPRTGAQWCEPRAWINGLLDTCSKSREDRSCPGPQPSCSIGGHPSMQAYFDGLIDEVRIFDHALTPGEVAQEAVHYWCDSLSQSDVQLHYDFNEGGGLIVHDASPYHDDLDISAAEALGDAAWVSNGVCGSALEFDTQHPEVSGDCLQTGPIPIGKSVTFSMWVYLHDMVPQPIQAFHCKSVGDPHENFVFVSTATVAPAIFSTRSLTQPLLPTGHKQRPDGLDDTYLERGALRTVRTHERGRQLRVWLGG